MKSLVGIVLLLILLGGLWLGCRRPETLVRAPYPQQVTGTEAVLVWRTSGPADPVVKYGLAPDKLFNAVRGEAITVRTRKGGDRALAGVSGRTHQYEARLRDLEPGQRYYYAVYRGDALLAGGDDDHFLETAPRRDARVGFWVLGDSGTGGEPAREVYEGMIAWTAAHDFKVDLFLHVGDMAYWDGLDREFQRNFFEMYGPTLRTTPCWPAPGNHEMNTADGLRAEGPYFDAFVVPTRGEAGGEPSGTESYYSFDYGPVHVVSLNSCDLPRDRDTAMANWLRRDLRSHRKPWTMAFFHHAPYSKGTHDSDTEAEQIEMREVFIPILEEGGVDLVLSGHSHLYERSMLMDGAYETPAAAANRIFQDGDGRPDGDGAYRKSKGRVPHGGTLHVVVGNGGAEMGRTGHNPLMRVSLKEYGSLLLEVAGHRLEGRMVNRQGRVLDHFAVVKQGWVNQARMAHPWQPSGPLVSPDVPYFLEEVRVALTAVTKWAGEEIYYTLDGTEPGIDALRYDVPFTLAADTEVRARTIDVTGDRQSPVSARRYRTYTKPLRDPAPVARNKLSPGVSYHYYEGVWESLPEFTELTPATAGAQATPSLEHRPRDDDFAVRFTGFLDAPVDGIYGFYLSSDDGSRLSVAGEVVVDHDGLHGPTEKAGFIGLKQGYHPFVLDYFERLETELLSVQWAGPGFDKQPVPGGAFFHGAGLP